MRLSAKQLDWTVEQIREYLPRGDRTPSLDPLSNGDFYRGTVRITDFLRALQGTLESTARRERRQALLRALAKFAEALRIEGD